MPVDNAGSVAFPRVCRTEPKATIAATIEPDLWCLFAKDVHGDIDRRAFLDRTARFAAASGTPAAALLAGLSPDFAHAQKVAPGSCPLCWWCMRSAA